MLVSDVTVRGDINYTHTNDSVHSTDAAHTALQAF